jgi:hypothetical protein
VQDLCPLDGDPIHCAIAAWHGSWQRPDNGIADVVRTTVTKDDAPDFEMPDVTRIDTAEISSAPQSVSRDTASAPSSSPAPDDLEHARASPLFPVKTKPSESSPSDHPAPIGLPPASRKTAL